MSSKMQTLTWKVSRPWLRVFLVFFTLDFIPSLPLAAQAPAVPQTRSRLETAEPTRIADSVTGVYYHTGGRRAYPEMLQLYLEKVFPQTQIEVINAGISGHTTNEALRRLESDVLSHRPHLVTIMFGLNDMVSLSADQFEANLNSLVDQIRAQGAEIILATPNGVIENAGRPSRKLGEYCEIIFKVGLTRSVPVCPIHRAYSEYHDLDRRGWRLLFSDEIHPNMDGHRLNARLLGRMVSGKTDSLDDIGPPEPAIPHSLQRRATGQTLRILAAAPADRPLRTAFSRLNRSIEVEISAWDISGKSLVEIEESARQIRKRQELDLVVVSVPNDATPGATASDSEISSFSWILNHSLSFGKQEWDVVVIAPSVWGGPLNAQSSSREEFIRRMTRAQDLSLIARNADEEESPEELLVRWLRNQGW